MQLFHSDIGTLDENASGDQVVNDMTMHIGEPKIATLITVGQPFVIDSQ